jgi:methionyl-tRNA synthetase
VNDEPHLGHAYTTILGDVLARYHRAQGDDVHFLTGTDEHGLKVQQAALKRGADPQAHTDEFVLRFQDLWQRLYISNDDFIRTTQKRHKDVVQALLQDLHDKGELYKADYEGFYSVSEERFITEKEMESGAFRQVEKIKETNWFFRMSAYQERLVDHIKKHPDFIQPETRRNEVLGFLRGELSDLCISRPKSRLEWGIELPFDSGYVTYVWFDALTNYISAIGYGKDDDKFQKWWPVNYHLIGKDILTTHAVYWPTMLMAAGLPLPQAIYAHGWWLMGDDKMSKSQGNVVQPLDLIEHIGVDPVRYLLMREMVLGQDATFTTEQFLRRYNADLANDLGNLTNRISKFIRRHFEGKVPPPVLPDDDTHEKALQAKAEDVVKQVPDLIGRMKIATAIGTIMELVRQVNVYLEQTQPWKQVKEDKAAAGNTLYVAAEALRIAAQLLHPVMPNRMDSVRQMVGVASVELSELGWGLAEPGMPLSEPWAPFPRLESLDLQKAASGPEEEDQDTYGTFEKTDLRIAEVLAARPVKDSDKLLQLNFNLDGQEHQIIAGIAQHYKAESLIGRRIVLVANLKPAKIMGIESQGMLLAMGDDESMTIGTVDDPEMVTGSRVG